MPDSLERPVVRIYSWVTEKMHSLSSREHSLEPYNTVYRVNGAKEVKEECNFERGTV